MLRLCTLKGSSAFFGTNATLNTQLMSSGDSLCAISTITEAGSIHGDASSLGPLPPLSEEESKKASSDLKLKYAFHTPLMSGIALCLSLSLPLSELVCLFASMCVLC